MIFMINELHPHEIDHVQDLDPNLTGDQTPIWVGFISSLSLPSTACPAKGYSWWAESSGRTALSASEVNMYITRLGALHLQSGLY